MKKLPFILVAAAAVSCGHKNLPDAVDVNNTPAPMEQREEEVINRTDAFDDNETEAFHEEREHQEESVLDREGELFDEDGLYE